MDIRELRDAVLREPLRREGMLQPHLLEHGQLHLEEFDGRALDGERGAGRCRGSDEEHRVRGVFGDGVGNVCVYIRRARHAQRRRADAFHPKPSAFRKPQISCTW